MEIQIVVIILALMAITLVYKLSPFREADAKKPVVAILPKYKMRVRSSLADDELLSLMSGHGFKSKKRTDAVTTFSRGSIVGDISIKLTKVNVAIRKLGPDEREITLEAGWLTLLDTGDHWKLITELAAQIADPG